MNVTLLKQLSYDESLIGFIMFKKFGNQYFILVKDSGQYIASAQ